jgi:hypothetical protein
MISRRRTITVREASRRRLGKVALVQSSGFGAVFFFGSERRRSASLGWRCGGCRERN